MPKDGDRWAYSDLFTHHDWCDIQDRINDLIEDPTGSDETDCPELEQLECPEKPHIWTKEDIEEVRDKMDKICDENEDTWSDFDDDQLWSAEILNEIEEAIENGWCNCCWDCANARDLIWIGGSVNPWADSWIVAGAGNITVIVPEGGDPNDGARRTSSDTATAAALAAIEAGDEWNKYATLEAGWKKVQEQAERELERAEARLEELEEIRDEICAEAQEDDSRQGACDNANEAVTDQEEDIEEIEEFKDQIDEEYERLETEAQTQWDEVVAQMDINNATAAAYPPYAGTANVAGSIPAIDSLKDTWDREQVKWREEDESCEAICGEKPIELEDWVALIPTDDHTCWEPEPYRCREKFQMLLREESPGDSTIVGGLYPYAVDGRPIISYGYPIVPVDNRGYTEEELAGEPMEHNAGSSNNPFSPAVTHIQRTGPPGGWGHEHPPLFRTLYFRVFNLVIKECLLQGEDAREGYSLPTSYPYYYREPCGE